MSGYGSDNASEVLKPQVVTLTPVSSPSPKTSCHSSSSSSSSSSTAESCASRRAKGSREEQDLPKKKLKHTRKRRKPNPGPGDATYFRCFAPNNPEFQQVGQDRFFQLDPSDEEGNESDNPMVGSVEVPAPEPVIGRAAFAGSARTDVIAQGLDLSRGTYDHGIFPEPGSHKRQYSDLRTNGGGRHSWSPVRNGYPEYSEAERPRRPSYVLSVNEKDSSRLPQDAQDAAQSLSLLKHGPPRRTSTSSDAVATSPVLLPYVLSPSEAATERTLPAIGSESSARTAPNPNQSLPGVRELWRLPSRDRASSYSSANMSPPLSPQQIPRILPQPVQAYPPGGSLSRTSTATSHEAGSPIRDIFTHRSPEVMPSTINRASYHPRRSGPRQGPNSIPSLISHTNTSSSSSRSYSTTTSSGTSSGNEGLTPLSCHGTLGDQSTGTEPFAGDPSTKYLHYPTVPVAGYKCQHDGCDAAPFTTQYLLNSHANVHSQERPHFCPVKDCQRGEGGQGFKRKNEMIRHRLVHQSPGYLCPWCDREHRYPRPDNLQRHVTSHHKDKSRDDPALLAVLAQRAPGGASKGRRRRG